MRIGINGQYFGPGKTGVGRNISNLLSLWGNTAHAHEFWVYYSDEELDAEDAAVLGTPNVHGVHLPRPFGTHWFHLWYNISLPRALARDRVDCFFSPDYFCPVVLPRHLLRCLTIHDVSYIVHPEWYSWQYRMYCTVNSVWPARRADCILTASEYQRQEIIRYLKIIPERVHVTARAADLRFRPAGAQASTPLPSGITGPFFLFVGMIFNRRHVVEALDAFERFARRTRDRTTQFVLRGKDLTLPAQHIAEKSRAINARLGRNAVIQLPFVSDETLITLYQRAAGFLYLSTYEGFGLPVLEALACGTPTVTVHATAIPEAAGEAAVYVDPEDPEALSRVLERLINDTAWVQTLRQESLAQARQFTWARTARETLDAIESTRR